jgi:hypothetical protein
MGSWTVSTVLGTTSLVLCAFAASFTMGVLMVEAEGLSEFQATLAIFREESAKNILTLAIVLKLRLDVSFKGF